MPKKLPAKQVVGYILKLWRISPGHIVAIAITRIIGAILISAIGPIFIAQLINQIAKGKANFNTSLPILIWYVLVQVIGGIVLPRLAMKSVFISESKMQIHVGQKILKHMMARSLAYHANKMSGGLVSDSNKLIGSIERLWDTLIFSVIPISVGIISSCIALAFIFWPYAIALFIISILITLIAIKIQLSISPLREKVTKKYSRLTAFFADSITNVSAVKAFSGEDRELEQYTKKSLSWYRAMMAEMKGIVFVSTAFGTIMTLINATAFTVAIFVTEYRLVDIGVVYLVLSYSLNIAGRLWEISHSFRDIMRVIGEASPMIRTMNEEIEIKDSVNPEAPNFSDGKIEFRNMTFTHSESEKPLFKNFNLAVDANQQIGLVGRSGSGKTSLTRLLLRFSDIQEGQILIDGQDISKIKQSDLHNQISYVPQEPILFHRSLYENIAYGRPEASQAEVAIAAKKARAYDFINELPKKFDTLVGERGIKLSGGQRQRIAIARAILKNSPILVLDEATSALDSETESLIQEAMAELMSDRTCIVIAHRLSTIARLDKIVVLDNGKIVETGSHQELLQIPDGTYAKLWQHQSGGFIK